jgi:hypothetical protein
LKYDAFSNDECSEISIDEFETVLKSHGMLEKDAILTTIYFVRQSGRFKSFPFTLIENSISDVGEGLS